MKAASEQVPDKAKEGRSALDVFADRVRQSGDRVALRRKEGGVWKTTTFEKWDEAANEIAGGLRTLGVEVGDRVVVLAQTRQEWVETDLGILKAGAITVPIYPSNLSDQCEYIINDSGARICIVEDPHQLEKLLDPEYRGKLDKVEKVLYMTDQARLERPDSKGRKQVALDEVLPEDHQDRTWVMPLADLRERGREWLKEHPGELDAIRNDLDPEQASTIVYTSGTTGPPKGVVLTHGNLAFECDAIKDLLNIGPDDEQLLFLPLAHAFAKILLWSGIVTGAVTSFAESVPKLIANMREVKPTFMGAVPRVYEKAYAKVQQGFADKRKNLLGKLVIDFALARGKERSRLEQQGRRIDGIHALTVQLADKLVFSKVRETFGGRLRYFISGGAPLSREIAEFFHAAGVLILEGYGLTETTAASHVNRPDSYEFGTVGKAFPGVECKIAEDGEILLRGGNIMKEYFGKPEATAEAIDREGWFHTGDIGVIRDNGNLKITDRKKDLIVTAGGKNVAPQNIENAFKAQCPLASQMMVYGDKRKYLTALVTLNQEAIEAWGKERGLRFDSYADLTRKDEVKKEIQRHIDELNRELASYETIKKFVILDKDFDQESGELTPTLKVKRKVCTEKYRDLLEGLYEGA